MNHARTIVCLVMIHQVLSPSPEESLRGDVDVEDVYSDYQPAPYQKTSSNLVERQPAIG
jgi:hypothetical protein